MQRILASLSFAVVVAAATSVTISNVNPRTNVTGHIIDAHDGTYNQWTPGGDWYYYAMGYGTCQQGGDMCHSPCGYGYSWIGIWKSPNMQNGTWELVREARDSTWPAGIYFRVHTVYNKKTAKYVMWANNNGVSHSYSVGTSSSPEGPFTFVRSVDAGRGSGGDFDIFVDDDESAFLIYTEKGSHSMAIERLADDYLSSAAAQPGTDGSFLAAINASDPDPPASNVSSGVIGNEFVEAPAMFKRKGVYYALFDNCCCFCGHGSGIGVYTAAQPLGPWVYHNNVGCLANATLAPGCGCGMTHGTCDNYGESLTKAQQNFVIRIPQADGSLQYVWTGDRWQSAEDGVKAHDLQYWSVLQFANVGGIDLPLQFTWQDEIQITV